MANRQDLTARLPNGQMFQFWEAEQNYEREVCTDYFGNEVQGKRVAGPITGLNEQKIRFSIDPRFSRSRESTLAQPQGKCQGA